MGVLITDKCQGPRGDGLTVHQSGVAPCQLRLTDRELYFAGSLNFFENQSAMHSFPQ
jgi:hypothetical protein